MKIKPFKLEHYFSLYEFSAKYLLSSSDCDGILQKDLLKMADSQTSKLWENLTLGYTESFGLPLLREEVAKLYENINAEQILVAAPEEGIFLAANAILEKGNHVVCTFPGYQSLYSVAEALGCEITKWQPDEDKNWHFDIEFLRANIRPNTKLIVFNFSHNPTGYLPSKSDFQQIIEIAREHDLYVLSDEMYRFLEFNKEDRLPSACEVYDKAVSLFGMSKTFGMAGTRIGWVITKDKNLYKQMAILKDFTTICSSAPSEILSLIALRAKDTIIENNLSVVKKNLMLLDSFFENHKDLFSWIRPKAGTICFPRLLKTQDSLQFCEKTVKETGIMLLPSSVYDYDNKHIRIGFGRKNMPEVLTKFDEYLKTVG